MNLKPNFEPYVSYKNISCKKNNVYITNNFPKLMLPIATSHGLADLYPYACGLADLCPLMPLFSKLLYVVVFWLQGPGACSAVLPACALWYKTKPSTEKTQNKFHLRQDGISGQMPFKSFTPYSDRCLVAVTEIWKTRSLALFFWKKSQSNRRSGDPGP